MLHSSAAAATVDTACIFDQRLVVCSSSCYVQRHILPLWPAPCALHVQLLLLIGGGGAHGTPPRAPRAVRVGHPPALPAQDVAARDVCAPIQTHVARPQRVHVRLTKHRLHTQARHQETGTRAVCRRGNRPEPTSVPARRQWKVGAADVGVLPCCPSRSGSWWCYL